MKNISDNDDISCRGSIEEGSCMQEKYILDQTGRQYSVFNLPKEMEKWLTKKMAKVQPFICVSLVSHQSSGEFG